MSKRMALSVPASLLTFLVIGPALADHEFIRGCAKSVHRLWRIDRCPAAAHASRLRPALTDLHASILSLGFAPRAFGITLDTGFRGVRLNIYGCALGVANSISGRFARAVDKRCMSAR
jgi:hypothetical protein